MSWIKTINESEAKGELKELYQQLKLKRGKVLNVMKVHSLLPKILKLHMDLSEAIMFGDKGLTREEREIIATMVAAANKCEYCIIHHGAALNHYWQDDQKLLQLVNNYKDLHLPEKYNAMIDYALKLTNTPNKVDQDDIQRLHRYGFTDEEILDINLVVSYLNFSNRIILGLGVEFDPNEVKGYKF
jgi:uncharacterized peroxidase-related enzyme